MPRILVVDDERVIQNIIVRSLKLCGMDPLSAFNTGEALTALASQRFDAILVDIVLGHENGWETLRLIRQSSAAPISMMSGVCVDEDVRLDAEKLGAQDVLQKPFTPDQLRECVTRLLQKNPAG